MAAWTSSLRWALSIGAVLMLVVLVAPRLQSSQAQHRDTTVVNVDDFGAPGDGIHDAEPAIQAAAASFGDAGGIIHLSCGKHYLIRESLVLGLSGSEILPNVTLQGCNHNPDDPASFAGQSGSLQTLGGIVRAANASVVIGRNGRLEHLTIVQQGVTTSMDSASRFAGTAILQAGPFPAGQGISVEDVNILGADICYDGRAGGGRVKMENVIGDCKTGFIFGQSPDTSQVDKIHPFPSATAAFPGYTIKSISGDGVTTTVTFTGASLTLPIGDYVTLRGVAGLPAAPTPGFTVTASRPGRIQFRSAYRASAAEGTLLDYSQVFLRPGVGIEILGQNDDSRFGDLFDFGHRIGLDAECEAHGTWNVGRFWGDNNLAYGVYARDCPFVHFNSVYIASIGGQGMHVIGSDLSIDDYKNTSSATICFLAELGGHIQIGDMDVANCSKYGVFPGAGSKIYIGSLVTANTPTPAAAARPAENLVVENVMTDLPPGSSVLGGAQSIESDIEVRGSTALLSASNTNLTGLCEEHYISSSSTVNVIAGAWGGRCVRIIERGVGRLIQGGNISLVGNNTFGGAKGSEIELGWDNVVDKTNAYDGVWREHWRR